MPDDPTTQETEGPVGEVMSWTLRRRDDAVELHSTPPEHVIDLLDLTRPGLEKTAAAARGDDPAAGMAHLLAYYRQRHPLPPREDVAESVLAEADKITRHVFRFVSYPEAEYGPDVDWEWDPRDDIEWVAAMYRFYWAPPLASAFRATRDDRYARAFVELTRDWIAKHPLDRYRKAHPVYTDWKGFAWLDIQTGIRATNLCTVFPILVHGESFTPDFLAVLLASLHDHQVKTEILPMGQVHNKAVFEQRGFINIAYTFPEFADSGRWLELGFSRAQQSLLDQTTSDGVQREWSFSYHQGVLNDAVEILERMEAVDFRVPEAYRDRVRAMFEYVYGIAGPDLGAPMFGDASRPFRTSRDRSTWQLYSLLQQGARVLGDRRFAARADLDTAHLPPASSSAFPEAGLYALRSGWDPQAIQLNLHCSPKGISSHDQPDNGTFELYAFGRWVMPDSGFYTYGRDAEGRAWHRRTRVHQTLTLNDADSSVAGHHLLWHSDPGLNAVVVDTSVIKARAAAEMLMKRGMLCKETHDNVIRFAPPLIISESEQEWAIEQILAVLG